MEANSTSLVTRSQEGVWSESGLIAGYPTAEED